MSAETEDTKTRRRHLLKLTAEVMQGTAFQLKTEPIEYLFAHVRTWLQSGAIGVMVVAESRVGKSCAMRWVLKALNEYYGVDIPHIEIPFRFRKKASEPGFFQHCLIEGRHSKPNRGVAKDLRDRFTDFLKTQGASIEANMVILWIDEAQFILEEEWKWLLNIYNETTKVGTKVFFVFSGTHELLSIKQNFINTSRREIVARFMLHVCEFEALTNSAQLKQALTGFENLELHGKSFVDYFIPQSTSFKDFKLSLYSAALWDEFAAIWKKSSKRSAISLRLPMHYPTAAVLSFLSALGDAGEVPSDSGHELLRISALTSGFFEYASEAPARSSPARGGKAKP